MTLAIETRALSWPMREPFVIARGSQDEVTSVLVTLRDADGIGGHGEACGVPYAGETPETMIAQIDSVRRILERDPTRTELLRILPPGGARCAVDAALWDLEAKRRGRPAWQIAGLTAMRRVLSAVTIGIRTVDRYEASARALAAHPLLKVKVDGSDPLAALRAVRRGAPKAKLIVDPNQSWSVATLKALAPKLAELGVVLLEQPIPVGAEAELDGYRGTIPLCADELIDGVSDLPRARGRFDVINIKLDKTGGLTAALALADAAQAQGFGLMVGCMAGSSLAMAPATVLAQRCAFVDLDGPLLQAADCAHPLHYEDGLLLPPEPALWG